MQKSIIELDETKNTIKLAESLNMSYGFGKQYDKIEEEEQKKKKNAISSVFSATKQRPSNDEKWHVNTKIKR